MQKWNNKFERLDLVEFTIRENRGLTYNLGIVKKILEPGTHWNFSGICRYNILASDGQLHVNIKEAKMKLLAKTK